MIPVKRRSGGPRSPEGRRACSQNALKNGVYSTRILLPGESIDEFKKLERQLAEDFQPRDVVEKELVREITNLSWKKRRVDRLDHAALIRELDEPLHSYEFRKQKVDPSDKTLSVLANHSIPTEDDIEHYRQLATSIKSLKLVKLTPEILGDIPKKHADLWREIVELVRDSYGVGEHAEQIPIDALANLTVATGPGARESFLKHLMGKLEERTECLLWAYQFRRQLQEEIVNIKERRLLKYLNDADSGRARDDLNRAFFRTLAELRRHQEWRHEHGVRV